MWKGHVGLLGFNNHLKGIKSTSTSTQCFCEPMVHPCSHAHGSECAKVCSCGVPEHFLLHFSQRLYEFLVFTLRCYSVRGMDWQRIFILDLDHHFRDFVTCLFLLLRAHVPRISSPWETWHLILALLLHFHKQFHGWHVQGCVLPFWVYQYALLEQSDSSEPTTRCCVQHNGVCASEPLLLPLGAALLCESAAHF